MRHIVLPYSSPARWAVVEDKLVAEFADRSPLNASVRRVNVQDLM